MARGQRQLVWITPVHFDHSGRPIDPDYGVPEGGHPDQGLPGFPGFPDRPGHLPSRPGWGGEHPGNRPPGSWPGRPVDPGWGVEEGGGGGESGQLPVYPIDPEAPDQGLPPEVPPGLPELPPGTIWPPLPPSVPTGKALAVVYISGVGARWAVIDIPERPERPVDPDYGVDEGEQPSPQPPRPGQRPPRPDQGLPGQRPPRPDQGLPPTGGRPPRPDQGLPGQRPPRPDQGLPPTAQPKR
jgi:hypothetical protein